MALGAQLALVALLAFVMGAAAGRFVSARPVSQLLDPAAVQTPNGAEHSIKLAPAGSAEADRTSPPRTESLALPEAAISMSPRRRALMTIAEALPVDRLSKSLFVAGDPKLERLVFERFVVTKDRRALETLSRTLQFIESSEVRSDVLAAFLRESSPDRRRALAWVMGANWEKPDMRPAVIEALSDPDPAVAEAAMNDLQIEDLENPGERIRVANTLRGILLSEGPRDLRAQAALAMKGTLDPSDVRVLLNLLIQPENYFIQIRAMEALPTGSGFRKAQPALWNQTVDRLLAYALDASHDGWPREEAAETAMEADHQWRKRLTSAQITTIETILGPRAWRYED